VLLDLHADIMPERDGFGSSSQEPCSRSTPLSPLYQCRIWYRLGAVVCVVGRRLQLDYSDADSLGLFKALGYCAECATSRTQASGKTHVHEKRSSRKGGGDIGWIRGI